MDKIQALELAIFELNSLLQDTTYMHQVNELMQVVSILYDILDEEYQRSNACV